jgi:hypothetical protein
LNAARLALVLTLASPLVRPAAAQLAIITNRSTATADISLDDLRRLFLGQTSQLSGKRVTLVECTPQRAAFYRSVAQLSEAQVDRTWMAVVFQGSDATPPRKLPSAEEVLRYVAEHEDTIAFVPADAADRTVKVLQVNGLTPRQPGYPIR